jgi:ribokinase
MVHEPGKLLTVLGAVNWDTTLFVSKFAQEGEEVPVIQVEEFPGGKGANVAVAAAKILGPGKTAIIGAVGDDSTSRTLVEGLEAEGVPTEGVVTIGSKDSGRAYIIVDELGRKTIHTHFGANDEMKPSHLERKGAAAALSRSNTIVIMDTPIPVAMAASKIGRRRHAHLIYSPGVRTSTGLRALEPVLALVDELVLDRSEMTRLCETKDYHEATSKLTRMSPRLTVVATLGPRGSKVVTSNSSVTIPGVDLADFGKKAVNSTGSGDAFLAAFSSFSLLGHSPVNAAQWGNLAGALKATRPESRGSPSRDELEKNMRTLARVRGPRPGWPSNTAS